MARSWMSDCESEAVEKVSGRGAVPLLSIHSEVLLRSPFFPYRQVVQLDQRNQHRPDDRIIPLQASQGARLLGAQDRLHPAPDSGDRGRARGRPKILCRGFKRRRARVVDRLGVDGGFRFRGG